ncbi:hypothetical protein Ancab_023171 [Ancistrocladus abbreviatus]
MRRLSLVDKEIEDDDEEQEFYLPRISFEAIRPPMPRRSFHRGSISLTSSWSLINLRHSFHYDRLPQAPIHLTVVKLDGSCFAIEVGNCATVSDLKLAVERAFSHMPRQGPGKVSWRHVWGHFCLSYDGEKLLNDEEFIKDYGVKDGDQLKFVRHISTSYNLIKKRSRKLVDFPKVSRTPDVLEESEEEVDEEVCDHVENLKCQQCRNEDQSPRVSRESLFTQFFKGWFVYSRLEATENPGFEVEACRSRLADGFIGCFRSLFPFYVNKRGSVSGVSRVEI